MMVPQLEAVEGAFFVGHGYAYVLTSQQGPLEEVADAVFGRFRGDAGAVLDWLGRQPWFDGRLGTHGVSLVGSMAFATIAAASEPGAPAGRAGVQAAVCTTSFSRICPTLFLWGHGLALETSARFLFIAEQKFGSGRRQARDLLALPRMAVFFGMREWPGLWEASLRRPLTAMDEALWGRRNALWRAGIREQSPGGAFWRGGVDVQCDLAELGGQCPPLGIVAGWFDVFVRQALDDFQAAQAQVPGRAQLTVCGAGHLGLSMRYGQLVLHETLALYDECLRGMDRAVARSRLGLPDRRAVRLELVGAPAGQNWLECDAWPPEPAETMGWFVAGGSGHGQLALAEPPGEGSLEYVYDPGSPTPYEGGGWLNLRKEGQRDQSSLECRADVLVCSSPELEDSIDVVGEVRATLFVSSSAAECDFLVRLCVVPAASSLPWRPRWLSSGPEASLSIMEGLSRVRFGDSPAVVEEVRRVEVDLGPIAYRFQRGERIRIHICSAAHPRALRHPLSADDWLAGDGAVGPPARQRVHFGAGRPSALWLPLRGPSLVVAEGASRFDGPAPPGERSGVVALPGASWP